MNGKTLGQLLSEQAQREPDRPYLFFQEEKVSYGEMEANTQRFAQAFREAGVKKGDHVALFLPNEPEYLYCWFGLSQLGAVSVTVNTQLKGESLQYVLQASDSRLVILAKEFISQYREMAHGLKSAKAFLLEPLNSSGGSSLGYDSLNRLIPAQAPRTGSDSPVRDVDPLIITFTSGTTGLPKLVANSHRPYIRAAQDLAGYCAITAQDRIYTHLPLYHANPQVYCVLTSLAAGASMILAPRFSASRFWPDIRKYGATAFSYVGAVLPILLAQPEQPGERDHPAKKCFGGGAPKEVYDEFTRRFGVEVLELYGMSETGTWNTINRPGRGKSGTVGTRREGFSIQIVDDDDNPLPAGKIGEIVIRPEEPFLMFSGYYKDPEETTRCSRNWWFHTGDLGKVDDEGYYYFCGRKKETIRRGGENIPPGDIERVVNQHPAVLESAAVGVADPVMEEEIKVVAVLRPGSSLKPKELFDWAKEKLPKFMAPRYIEFRQQLPKSASEKIQKMRLKAEGLTPGTWDAKA